MVPEPGPVHHAYMVRRKPPQPAYGRTFIREWREHREMTLEALAEAVGEKIGGMTHASLSRIERGLQPYSQPILEAIAEALDTKPAILLTRDPNDRDGVWAVWDMVVGMAKKP